MGDGRKSRSWIICAALLLFAAGCGDSAALDISFVPDPNRNAPRDILEQVGTIELIADSATGLYPAGTEHRGGQVEVFDVDGDGDPELVATIDITQMSHLPVVRLEQGGLPDDVTFDLIVQGARRGGTNEMIAWGDVRGIDFTRETVRELELPFNIKDRYLPPRVLQAGPPNPDDGVEAVLVMFSKPMELSSLNRDTIRIFRLNGKAMPVAAKDIDITVFPGEDQPTYALYIFESALEPGSYRIDVTTDARDASPERRPLDQVPLKDGPQPYTSVFLVAEPAAKTAADEQDRNPSPGFGSASMQSLCNQGLCDDYQDPAQRPACGEHPCPTGTSCDEALTRCLPLACPESCGEGLVCHPNWNLCVIDCRPAGTQLSCPDTQQCGEAGICAER